MADDGLGIIDNERTACLCDVGGHGYLAASAISTDGTPYLVLAQIAALGDDDVRCDLACSAVPHEQAGPLPPRWRDRVQLAPLRCGRRTKTGTACRTCVGRPGAACVWHRESVQ